MYPVSPRDKDLKNEMFFILVGKEIEKIIKIKKYKKS